MPEVGHGEEKKIQTTIDAYRFAMRSAAQFRPDTVVVTSPHSVMYADYFHISPGTHAEGSFSQFGAPKVKIEAEYDTEFVSVLSNLCGQNSIPAGTMGERNRHLDHGTMIPIRFLQENYSDFKLVRIGLSGLNPIMHYRLGQYISKTADELNRKVVVIASGDLSHKLKPEGPYGFAPEGPVFDSKVTDILGRGDFLSLLEMDSDLCESAAECGLRSFWIMAGTLDKKSVESSLISYEGPFGVGYSVSSFIVTGTDEARDFSKQYIKDEKKQLEEKKNAEDSFVRLARYSLETYVKEGMYAEIPENLPNELTSVRAGAFVSIKKDGRLRGCIGTILPVHSSLAEEILHNAVSAAVHDPRFAPITPDELDKLVYSVDVLSTPEPIESSKQLDVKRYGVIVENGNRRGLLLPDLAGVDTPLKQIEIACQKAGISPDEDIKMWRFEVVRHK
ncbi:MAG: AmmeMemoRadiSam system protein A [Clostridia bacterium]|jgi:AmmeMemoRadiSam system protein A/AmmeMemoRadiSam system protein B|nr:AmmeMemoRadiSam system protein A [Clostridia bacterium]